MAPKNRVIIDTDPGVDDVLAILLALSSAPEVLEVELISVTYGNVDVENCLRNVVSLFHQVQKEMEWRKSRGQPEGFEMLKRKKPLVAVGASKPLADQLMMADFFHGIDGLGGIYSTHPHLTPQDTWKDLFAKTVGSTDPDEAALAREISGSHQTLFMPSSRPAHEEILRILCENEPDMITLVAIGPLTNLATAAAADAEAFLRAKEVIVMGGAIEEPGNVRFPPPLSNPKMPCPPFLLIKQPPSPLRTLLNLRNQITPSAEFNTYADSVAAARVFALTSPHPQSTMPPIPPVPQGETQPISAPPTHLQSYPENLSSPLKLTLFPLDITTAHMLMRKQFNETIKPLIEAGSPLADWASAFLASTFHKMETLYSVPEVGLQLHDPLTIWYLLVRDDPKPALTIEEDEDVRVETSGQWTRGMCVVDRRNRKSDKKVRVVEGELEELPGDHGNWLNRDGGNRIAVAVKSPWVETFGGELIRRVFGV